MQDKVIMERKVLSIDETPLHCFMTIHQNG